MKRYLSPVLLLVIFAVASLAWLGCATHPATGVVIAAVAPMTGKYGEMGNDLLAAVRMAVEDRNAAGGINGAPVSLVVEDDKASPMDAVTVAHMLIANRAIVGVVGDMNSGTALAASSVYNEGGMAMVMPVPTNPQITEQGFHNIFRIPITDDKQGPAIVKFMIERLGKSRIAIVHNKEAYGEGIATEARKAIEAHGLTPVAFMGLSADDQDYRAIITRLKKLNPDAVFFGGGYSEAAILIKQARELGLDVPFVMGDGCFDSQLMAIAGPAANGCFVSNIAPTTAPDERAQDFYRRFLAKNRKIVAFAPLGYAATTVLLDAIEKAPNKTREGVLKTLQDPAFSSNTILGVISFAPNGDSRNQRIFMHMIKDGQFQTTPW